MQSEYCQQCRQPLEEWEAGLCEGCGTMTIKTRTKYRELIIARQAACNCGCSGSDPHHKRYYKRIVNVISDTSGTVRLPMSSQPVAVKREILISGERPVFGAWTVVRDAIVFDKY